MINHDLVRVKIGEALQVIMNTPKSHNNAIVFDIDDTLICSTTQNLITPVAQFYQFIRELGIIPVIITARIGHYNNIYHTISQLQNLGIDGFNKIYFMPIYEADISRYKRDCRKSLVDSGLNIIMSIGDMHWDIGEYGGYGILLR